MSDRLILIILSVAIFLLTAVENSSWRNGFEFQGSKAFDPSFDPYCVNCKFKIEFAHTNLTSLLQLTGARKDAMTLQKVL